MAASTYGDLCPGSRWVGMVLRNLSTWKVQIPPKTMIGNGQTAEVVPNLKVFEKNEHSPSFEGAGRTAGGQLA